MGHLYRFELYFDPSADSSEGSIFRFGANESEKLALKQFVNTTEEIVTVRVYKHGLIGLEACNATLKLFCSFCNLPLHR